MDQLEKMDSNILSEALYRPPGDTKISQQGKFALKNEHSPQSPNLIANENKIHSNGQQVEEFSNEISESVLEASKNPLKQSLKTEQSNLSSNQNQAQNEQNFITLSQISEPEKIEIIQTGFQRQAEGKISLKKY